MFPSYEINLEDGGSQCLDASPLQCNGDIGHRHSADYVHGSFNGQQLLPSSPNDLGISALDDYFPASNNRFSFSTGSPRPRAFMDDASRLNGPHAVQMPPFCTSRASHLNFIDYPYGTSSSSPTLVSSSTMSFPFLGQPEHDYLPTIEQEYPNTYPLASHNSTMFQERHLGLFHTEENLDILQEFPEERITALASLRPNSLQPSLSLSYPAEETFRNELEVPVLDPVFDEPFTSDGPPSGQFLLGHGLPLDFSRHVNCVPLGEQHHEYDPFKSLPEFGSQDVSDTSNGSKKRQRDHKGLSQLKPNDIPLYLPVGPPNGWNIASRVKRQRTDQPDNPTTSSKRPGPQVVGHGDDEDLFDSGNDDSDVYVPSRSPSPAPIPGATSPSSPTQASSNMTKRITLTPSKGRKGRRKGKGKAKGSAARALAIITEARQWQEKRIHTEMINPDLSDAGESNGSSTWSGSAGISVDRSNLPIARRGDKRKHNPIPQPVPIPNLNKKSRGRKVPYIPALRGADGIAPRQGIPVGGVVTLSPSGRRGRRATVDQGHESRSPEYEQGLSQVEGVATGPDGEERTFVCVVPGCGKCFIRGEHLKRHIRSIHTDDKPHVCPFKRCGKTFSRKDNLGQHVRIHLDD